MERYGLVIGCNYFDSPYELSGCINDTKMLRRWLLKKGFSKNNVTVLRDDGNGYIGYMEGKISDTVPTKKNIIDSLKTLITLANSSKSSSKVELFFSYSGHGTYVTDVNKDEKDGKDEAIVPVDCDKNGYIVDDEFRGIFKNLKSQIKCYTIMDCCHSGTNLDLPFAYELDIIKKKIILKENSEKNHKELKGKQIIEPILMKRFSNIGTNSIVLPGSIIEEGVLIASGSLFYGESEPWTVYKGNPAKPIKKINSEVALNNFKILINKYGFY